MVPPSTSDDASTLFMMVEITKSLDCAVLSSGDIFAGGQAALTLSAPGESCG